MAVYSKVKRSNDFDGDAIGLVLAHMFNLGATQVTVSTRAAAIAFTTDVRLSADQIPHLELTEVSP